MALTSIIAVVLAVAINGGNAKGECAIHAFLIDWDKENDTKNFKK